MAEFSLLPQEILVHILDFLDWRSLLLCTSVCSRLNLLVQCTTALQYKIELACAGLVDNCPRARGWSYADRFRRLRQHVTDWKRFAITGFHTMALTDPEGWAYELQGGLFVRTLGSEDAERNSAIMIVTLPSNAGCEYDEPRRYEIDIDVQDFSLDPEQDLIVLFERSVPATTIARIHLRSLTDLSKHPSAKQAILEHELGWKGEPLGWHLHAIQIAGDLFGVLFEPVSDENMISGAVVIWNWRLGTVVAELHSEDIMSFDSFLLLSDRTFAIPSSSAGSISVFALGKDSTLPLHIKTYMLPRLAEDRRMMRITCRSDPISSCAPDRYRPHQPLSSEVSEDGASHEEGLKFRVAEGARVLCFVFDIFDMTRHTSSSIHLFTPLSTLLPKEADMQVSPFSYPVVLHWSEWGPNATRALVDVEPNSMVTFIHGWRFVMSTEVINAQNAEDAFDQSVFLDVLDFNPLDIRRDLQFAGPQSRRRTSIVQQPLTLPAELFFGAEDVVTALPYRLTRVPIVVRYEALMLDNERVIGVSTSPSGNVDTLGVFQIGPPSGCGPNYQPSYHGQ